MERRAFIGSLAGGFLAAPLAAEAQSAGKIQRVGIVFSGSRAESLALIAAFEEGLQERGYVEGRNLGIEHRLPRAEPIGFPQAPLSWRHSTSMCS
jgi:hypothetical protein